MYIYIYIYIHTYIHSVSAAPAAFCPVARPFTCTSPPPLRLPALPANDGGLLLRFAVSLLLRLLLLLARSLGLQSASEEWRKDRSKLTLHPI